MTDKKITPTNPDTAPATSDTAAAAERKTNAGSARFRKTASLGGRFRKLGRKTSGAHFGG